MPRPLPHFSPTPGSVPSSVMPLQLSSMPLQTSGCGVTVGASQNVPVLSGLTGQDAAAAAGADAVVEARGADHEAFVDVAVAVVVETVAELRRQRAAAGLAAGVRRKAFVDLTVAVVVLAVAGLDRAVPGGAAVLGHHVVRVGLAVGGDREAAAGGDAVADRARPAVIRYPFVDLAVAVVVEAVADLAGRDRLGDDVDQRRLDRVGVGQRHEDRLPGAARRRHRVGGGLVGRAQARCRSGCRPARPSGSPPSGA